MLTPSGMIRPHILIPGRSTKRGRATGSFVCIRSDSCSTACRYGKLEADVTVMSSNLVKAFLISSLSVSITDDFFSENQIAAVQVLADVSLPANTRRETVE